MNESEYRRLLYRRQFLLTSKDVEGLYDWKRSSVCDGGKTLYTHPDLECLAIEEGDRRITLLGYIFDWQNPEYTSEKILERLLEHVGFEELLRSTFDYGGRFAILYENGESCRIFHDAGGQREIYYHVGEEGISCGSQLPIMERFLNLESTQDKRALELYNSEDFIKSKKQWVGEKTIYRDTNELRPNFYLDIKEGRAVRYWPEMLVERKSLEWAAERGARMMKGFLKAASMRKQLIIPVTAGWDSRLLLAASNEISDDVKYFIIKFPWMDKTHYDITVPARLMQKLGKKFEIIEAPGEVDEDFKKVFSMNTAYSRMDNLVGIYNVLYKKFGEYMSISSHVSEVARSYRGTIKSPSGRLFSTYVGYDGTNEYANDRCQAWIDEYIQVAHDMNIDPLVLFYWEEGLNWEASHRTETDIALDEYCPFSCRRLLETLVSVDPSYRNKYNSKLYRRMMEKLWPQVLSEPINPSFKNTAKGVLVGLDWLYPVKRLLKRL